MFGSVLLVIRIISCLRKRKILRRRAIENASLRRERALLRRNLVMHKISETEFRSTYRLTRETFVKLLNIVEPHLHISKWNNRHRPETKLLLALRFFASGSYQRCIGNSRDASSAQSTVSKILEEVLDIFDRVINPQLIKFPSAEEREEIKDWFLTNYHVPNVIGCIDGTQIAIYPPATLENLYVNRKGFHSINVQVIADHTYKITNVVAKFPGSAHDSFVYRSSNIRDHLQDEYVNGNQIQWLLGDSGYPLEPWLLTPFPARTVNPDEMMYNEKFCLARSLVERCIGLLKGRWRCLCKQRQLHYHPRKAGRIINACVSLHNLCILERDGLLEELQNEEPEVNVLPANVPNNLLELGEQNRNLIIAHLLVQNNNN